MIERGKERKEDKRGRRKWRGERRGGGKEERRRRKRKKSRRMKR